MIGFVETCSSRGMIPIGAIACVHEERRNEHGVELRAVELADGKRFDLFEHDVADLRLRPSQLVPALPGVKLLHATVADGALGEIWDEPVIAWALCLDGEVRPVTPNGVIGGMSFWDDHYVEIPGGKIQAVGQHSIPSYFDDRDEMLQHYVAIDERHRSLAGSPAPEVSDLDRLIADYRATASALNASSGQSLPDGNPLEQAYLAATIALDSYEPRTFEELARSLVARFSDDAPPTDPAVTEIVRHARRLVGEDQ